MKRTVSAYLLAVILAGALALALDVRPVRAIGTIYIRADGSIDPLDAPIITYDHVTYAFTGNITSSGDGIVVQRDSIIIDGVSYTLQGSGSAGGIDLSSRSNVTIRNTRITSYSEGISFGSSSSNNTVSGNTIANNTCGIGLASSRNSISANTIANNDCGIWLDSTSSNSTISGNTIANNGLGIYLWGCLGNHISGNNITANTGFGVFLEHSSNNTIFHNNLIDNTNQVYSSSSVNLWDDGYSSGGNYWSDYTGVDANLDGVGDTPYEIDAYNTDHYPLVTPYVIPEVPSAALLPLLMILSLVAVVLAAKHTRKQREP